MHTLANCENSVLCLRYVFHVLNVPTLKTLAFLTSLPCPRDVPHNVPHSSKGVVTMSIWARPPPPL